MQKKKLRLPSLLLAAATAASMLPAYLGGLPLSAAASDSTNLTIDFDYAEKNSVTSSKEALRLLGEESRTAEEVGEDYFRSNYNSFHWRHARTWCSAMNYVEQANNGDRYESLVKDSIRKYLISEDPADKYIALAADDTHEEHKRTPWETITITTDKVLDLNGHQLAIYYDRNRNHSDAEGSIYQNIHDPSAMNCVAFNIENGATLTIIDSSEWRGHGTGKIGFYGYMIDPFKYGIVMHTTRDLFHVTDGNLVVYGGTFEAGRKKNQQKSNFSLSSLKTVIGSAVELGVSIAEYATGLNTASAEYQDVLAQMANEAGLKDKDTNTKDEVWDDRKEGNSTVTPRNGTNQDPAKEEKADSPEKEGGRDQTVSEKKDKKNQDIDDGKNGTKESDNKSNQSGNAKDDANTKIAEAENKIVNQSLNKEKIMGIVDSAFELTEGIIGLFGTDIKTNITQTIKGTVVKVGNKGSFAAYGGRFIGYGSTPNTRNGVVEVTISPNSVKTWDHSKNQGGLAYIYGGTFEAYSGANVFNMVRYNAQTQYALQYVKNVGSTENPDTPVRIPLQESETGGVEVLYYKNQTELAADTEGTVTPIPVSTANVQVRGGTFRCFYDLMNLTICEEGDTENFRKFPGTMGSVNLGVESFNNELIQDGRIQINDTYGDGALVLLDDRKDETEENEGLYHYRLFCGDNELRTKSYLQVYPNTAKTNSSHSMQLATYFGTGKRTSEVFTNDEEGNNIRAPYRQTENYFDYMFTDKDAGNYSVMPNFHYSSTDNEQAKMDVYGESLLNSEIWYYPEPLDADGEPIGDVELGEAYAVMEDYDGSVFTLHDRDLYYDQDWYTNISIHGKPGTVRYYRDDVSNIRTNLHYFTYKVYRVDPLTRENLSESDTYGVDEPLISVNYGASPDSLKCKLPLKDVEQQIKKQRPDWAGYQAGEMYRIVLTVEERQTWGYLGDNLFTMNLRPAKTETSILFRCVDKGEQVSNDSEYYANKFTPVQWYSAPNSSAAVIAGSKATVRVVNAKAGMTDYRGDVKVFDLYYQWYECTADGEPIRMIAGTDNVYDPASGIGKEMHKPSMWNLANSSYTYLNTVDPEDPLADTYGPNGLPADQWEWTNRQLHMYSAETVTKEELTPDGSNKLSLANNNIYATNTDSCYIPEDLGGKYICVKVIALNTQWTSIFDQKQTFMSHPMLVQEQNHPLRAEAAISYGDGMQYASCDQPAEISVSKLTGLASDERITTVRYIVGGRIKAFTGLNITDPEQIPTVQYPDDFCEPGREPAAGTSDVFVLIDTESQLFGSKGTQAMLLNSDGLRYERAARGLTAADLPEFRLSDIRSGVYDDGVKAFFVNPYNATVGFDFSDYTTSDPDIVQLDQRGYLSFGGKRGTATVSVAGPDGGDVTAEVHVTEEFDTFEVTLRNPPEIGSAIAPEAVIPEDAPYSITNVSVYRGASEVSGTPAAYYEKYRVEITAVPKEDCRTNLLPSFCIAAEQPDGSFDTRTGYANPDYDYTTGQYLDSYTFSYTYDAQSDHAAAVIDKIYIDFPEKVTEGTDFGDWLDRVRVYTNGYDEGLDITVGNTFGPDAQEIASAYGYDTGITLSEPQIRYFLKGVQTGVTADITIPEALTELGDVFADDITVYANGVELEDKYHFGSGHVFIAAPDTLTVLDGAAPPVMPVYSVRPFTLKVGEALSAEDLLICADPRVQLRLTGLKSDSDPDTYLTLDPEEGTVTPIQAMNSASAVIYLYYEIAFDANADGSPEFLEKRSTGITRIYGSSEETPALPESSGSVLVTVKNPDGSTAYSQNCPFAGKYLSIPEVSNAFISSVSITQQRTIPALSGGAARLYGTYTAGESLTAETVSVSSLEMRAGTDCVYVFIRDQNGNDVKGIQISADGEHFTATDRISGLKPDTDYRISIRQGPEGRIYSRSIRTAAQAYGVSVGRSPVTSENLGDLAADGWHYDPESNTLTLKDFRWKGYGTACDTDSYAGQSVNNYAAINASGDLTVKLIGQNTVENTDTRGLASIGIFAEGSLTLTGNGSLTVRKDDASLTTLGLVSASGDICLNSTGELNFEQIYTALDARSGSVLYQNGTIDYQPVLISGSYPFGSILPTGRNNLFDFTQKVHSITVSVKALDGDWRTISESEIPSVINTAEHWLRIVPAHSDTLAVTGPEYYVSGSDSTICTYHRSCACGHIGTGTFTGYDLIINGTAVTASNRSNIDGNGVFRYIPESKTLVISGSAARSSAKAGIPLVYSGIQGLTIRVDSDSVLTGTAGTAHAPVMVLSADTCITGTGRLGLDAGGDAIAVRDSALCIENTDMTVRAAAGTCFSGENLYADASLVIRSAGLSLTFLNYPAYGFKGGISVEGSKITQPGKAKVFRNEDGAYILLPSTGGIAIGAQTLTITASDPLTVTLSKTEFTYTGKEIKAGSYLTVKSGDTALKYGTDFTMSYQNNVACGVNTASVTITGIGAYAGSVTKYYSIYPAKQAAPVLSYADGKLHVEWDGDSSADGCQVQYCMDSAFTGSTLHSVSYATKTACDLTSYPKAGETWYVRVRAYVKDSSGEKFGTWSNAASITLSRPVDNVTLSKTEFTYTGKEIKVGSYLTVKSGDTALKYGTDFTMSYQNNTEIGVNTASVTITGIGQYSGSVTKYYSILGKLDNVTLSKTEFIYTGKEIKTGSYLTVKSGDTVLKYGTDFTMSYQNNTEIGVNTASVTLTGIGRYTGSVTKYYSILGKLDNVTLSETAFGYTGKEIKVGSYLTVKSGDTALKYGTDFTMSYQNNTEIGINTASVTLTGIGRYTGSVTKTYSIVPAVQPKPTVTAITGGFKVVCTSDANAAGYQIEYCKDSSFSSSDPSYHRATYSTASANLTKYPEAGETWYVRVRAFITEDGTLSGTKYGVFSQTVQITAG